MGYARYDQPSRRTRNFGIWRVIRERERDSGVCWSREWKQSSPGFVFINEYRRRGITWDKRKGRIFINGIKNIWSLRNCRFLTRYLFLVFLDSRGGFSVLDSNCKQVYKFLIGSDLWVYKFCVFGYMNDLFFLMDLGEVN